MFTKKVFVDGKTVIDAKFLNDLQDTVLSQSVGAVKSVNNASPDADGNVTLTPSDISVQIPGTRFRDDLQILLETLYAGSEQDVTDVYNDWQGVGGIIEFFFSEMLADPGNYVVRSSGGTYRMRYLVSGTPDDYSEWRWIESYTEDGFFSAKLYYNKELLIDFDPDSGSYKVYDDALALKSELGTGGAREPYTEIEKFAKRGSMKSRSLRIQLNGLEPFDDGHLRLALWRCSRKYDRNRWLPARRVSEKEDNIIGYARLAAKRYGSGVINGPDYPSVPEWMPNEGLVEPFYNIYADDGSLLPYVEIPLDTFVLPLVKPIAVTDDRTAWEADPWAKCAVVGTNPLGGFLRFDFRVEKEDGTVVARCRNTVKIGARNVSGPPPSKKLLAGTESGAKAAVLRDWYVAID